MSRNVVSRLLLSVALLLLVLPVVASAEGPIDSALSLQACPTSPASPAVAPAESQPAPEDLFVPKPTFVCKGGMCSDNEQCEAWYGPGSTCNLGAGQTCGYCVD